MWYHLIMGSIILYWISCYSHTGRDFHCIDTFQCFDFKSLFCKWVCFMIWIYIWWKCNMMWHDILSHDTSCDVLEVFVIFKPMTCDCFSQYWQSSEIDSLHKIHIFQYMVKIVCVEFQWVPLKFHTKYLTHTWKCKFFLTKCWKFKSSQAYVLICIFEWLTLAAKQNQDR